MSFDASNETGGSSVPTGGQAAVATGGTPSTGITLVTSPDGSVAITNPSGPTVSLSVPVGDITGLTSTDGSVTITNPGGPVPNLEVPAIPGFGTDITDVSAATSNGLSVLVARSDHAHKGIEEITSATPAIIVTPTTNTRSLTQVIIADWTVANVRWYALDAGIAASGVGFSDVSSAAAGLVAKKTLVELGAIIPRIGNGRKIAIIVKSGSYVGQGDFALYLANLVGYTAINIIATDTNVTAGATAFLGDSADRTFVGMTTATGMNAAGYNPTGTPTTTSVQCLKVGGAAPAFSAEPAMPLWVRMRFDSRAAQTPTVALRNISRWVRIVNGTDTLVPLTAWPAAPAVGDTFYLEMPNVLTDAWTCSVGQQQNATFAVNVIGVRSAGNITYNGPSNLRLVGCIFTNVTTGSFQNGASILADVGYTDENGSARVVGMGVRAEGAFTATGRYTTSSAPAIGSVGTTGFAESDLFTWTNGSASFSGLNVIGCPGSISNPDDQLPTSLGGRSHNSEPACRVRGTVTGNGLTATGIAVRWSSVALDSIDISNNSALQGCVALLGSSRLVVSSFWTGTGNTTVALDLTISFGSFILIISAPTCTGTLGDVRLGDGTIVTWAQCITGIVDSHGNVLQGITGGTPLKPVAVANGVVVVALGAFGPTGSSATPTRWVKIPDGAGGFFTYPSYT